MTPLPISCRPSACSGWITQLRSVADTSPVGLTTENWSNDDISLMNSTCRTVSKRGTSCGTWGKQLEYSTQILELTSRDQSFTIAELRNFSKGRVRFYPEVTGIRVRFVKKLDTAYFILMELKLNFKINSFSQLSKLTRLLHYWRLKYLHSPHFVTR